MPPVELARFSEFMRGRFASGGRPADVLAVGQSPLGTANWLWLELDNPEARAWAFNTTVGTQLVMVLCTVDISSIRMTEAERAAALVSGRNDCSGIVQRMTFTGV